MQPSERNRQLNKARYDVLSIPSYVMKNNPTHGARHGPSMWQCMFYKAHEKLKKGSKHKNGYRNILDRWNNDDKYWKSLSDTGWTEERTIQYDETAPADHSYVATSQERSRNDKSWILALNAEGMQGPLNQRKRLYHE